ncbi:MAG TPA: protein kinase [Vicinamibacterales bacterium]|nr:protein kinase [Vicinamibacterales bacterium]
MALFSGTRIGVFETVSLLGEGGMGEVYRARDTRLDRDVALKVLPELFTSDPDRVARFEREAKVLASLNHPNIAQIYGFEHPTAASKHAAIAMELVEGQTLEQLLRDHEAEAGAPGLPLDRALAIARQIAIALDVAHDQGIIHRDLKPANVKVRDDGTVKVLDFGLAKAFASDAEAQQSSVSNSPTLTARSTQLGMIIGTAAYMSPEQAKARPVDRRADVWAFGAVLFEMLAGRRAFEGDDISDVLASVLKSEPDWALLPADLSAPVRRLLRRCLEKDPKKRLRDVAEGMLQLDEGLATGSTTSGVTVSDLRTPNAERRTIWTAVAATAVATALIVSAIGIWRAPEPRPVFPMRSLYVPPAAAALLSTIAQRDVAISLDGRRMAYVAGVTSPFNAQIYLRLLDQLEAQPLRGAQPAIGPFFSPDGEWLGFIDQADQTQLKKVSVLGGPSVTVTRADGGLFGGTWTETGIVFGVRGGALSRVAASGGAAVALTSLDAEAGDEGHAWPAAVPGTDVVLFAILGAQTGFVGSQLAAVNQASGKVARLGIDGYHPRYIASGHIVYATVDGTLRAVGFDPARMAITAPPVPVLEGVGIKPSGSANFDISRDGHLVFTGAGSATAVRTLTWVDRTGRETPIAAPARNYFYARVSPDGTRLSVDSRDEEQDIWIWDVKRETLSRLTDKPGPDQYGLWTKDHRVVFTSSTSGRPELFRHRPDGVGQPEQVSDSAAEKLVPFPNAVTPDGLEVIFRSAVGSPKNDLWVANMKDRKVRRLLATEHDERNAALSPAGDVMAFESDLSGGRFEVFVRPFPDVDAWQSKVSTEGGEEPVWSPDGREIFYLAGGKLMAVRVTRAAGGIELEKPVALFDIAPYFFGGVGRNYDVTPDGRRFVMVKNPVGGPAQSTPITIVMNWIEELRSKVK